MTPEQGLKKTNDVIDGMMQDPALAKLPKSRREVLRAKLLANLITENGSVTVIKSLGERMPRSTQVAKLLLQCDMFSILVGFTIV